MCVNHLPLMTATNLASVKFEIIIRESESSGLWFNGIRFDNVRALLAFLFEENKKACKKYKEKYGISAPYIISQSYPVYASRVSTCIMTHNKVDHSVFLFEEDQKLPERIANKKIPIFRCADIKPSDRFNISTLIRLHNAILLNRVIRPAYLTNKPDRYLVEIGDDLYEAEVKSFGGKSDFHLHFTNIDDWDLYGYYGLKVEDFRRAGSSKLKMDDGVVPWDYKENILKIMDIINAVRCAAYSLFTVDENAVICGSLRFEITRTRAGKWYLKGEAEDFTKAFNCSGLGEIREIAAKLFERRMTGVFPECNTKEELLALIEKIKK